MPSLQRHPSSDLEFREQPIPSATEAGSLPAHIWQEFKQKFLVILFPYDAPRDQTLAVIRDINAKYGVML